MVGASYLWSWEMSQSRRARAEGIGDEGVGNEASKTQYYDPLECRISGAHRPGVLEALHEQKSKAEIWRQECRNKCEKCVFQRILSEVLIYLYCHYLYSASLGKCRSSGSFNSDACFSGRRLLRYGRAPNLP